MRNSNDLRKLLHHIDNKSYPAYKDTRGSYNFYSYILNIDHVQGDPFASPSKLSVIVDGEKAGFPTALYDLPHKRIALQDHLTRLFYQKINQYNFKAKGSGKSGLLSVSRCSQEILERTACEIQPGTGKIRIRFEAGFPANGRRINASQLARIIFDFLPDCIENTLYYQKLNKSTVASVIQLAEDQRYIREQLDDLGLTAFVADGSILPRESGISSRPMKHAVPFKSPDSLKVTLDLPNRGKTVGMGIKKGITLIVGGGYHGKSTLLKALELGVYNHIAGDGREYVITNDNALKIRAEDGRSIKKTDISMFINNLPNKKDTFNFYTEDASGSTSQAANVIEGMESGTSLFLIDEDTCATNFMIRDELMQRVVQKNQEPITPFIERVRPIFEQDGISSIIVAGSSGSYFHVADCILQMDHYVTKDITEDAKKEARAFPYKNNADTSYKPPVFQRGARPNSEVKNNHKLKIKASGRDNLSINRENIDLRYVEQLADSEQTASLGYMLAYAEKNVLNGRDSLQQVVDTLWQKIEREGLASVFTGYSSPTNMAMPRKQEIYACFNRYRGLNL